MEKLKKVRKNKNYSIQYMANILKISKPFYWQLENGNRKLSYNMALKISEIFELKPDDLFYEYFKNKDN